MLVCGRIARAPPSLALSGAKYRCVLHVHVDNRNPGQVPAIEQKADAPIDFSAASGLEKLCKDSAALAGYGDLLMSTQTITAACSHPSQRPLGAN